MTLAPGVVTRAAVIILGLRWLTIIYIRNSFLIIKTAATLANRPHTGVDTSLSAQTRRRRARFGQRALSVSVLR